MFCIFWSVALYRCGNMKIPWPTAAVPLVLRRFWIYYTPAGAVFQALGRIFYATGHDFCIFGVYFNEKMCYTYLDVRAQ